MRPPINEDKKKRLADAKAWLWSFRVSFPETGHSWLKQLIVHMVLRKRAGSDPLAVLEGMPSVDDVADLSKRVSEYWWTMAQKRSYEEKDRTGP